MNLFNVTHWQSTELFLLVSWCSNRKSAHALNLFSENFEPAVGSYVLSNRSSNSRGRRVMEKEFVARVLDVDMDDYQLSYMCAKETKNKRYYYWPSEKDVHWLVKKSKINVE